MIYGCDFMIGGNMRKFKKIELNKCTIFEEEFLWKDKESSKNWMQTVMSSKQYKWLINYIENHPDVSSYDLTSLLLNQFPEENDYQSNIDAANIITNGPVSVSYHAKDDIYVVTNGNHRISTAKRLGYSFLYGKID